MKNIGLKLREAYRNEGPVAGGLILREAIKERRIPVESLSIRGLAEGMIGEQWHSTLQQWKDPAYRMNLREQSVVDASNFAAVTGQILIDMVRAKYELTTQVGNQIFRTVPVTNGNLQTHREQILTRVNDIAFKVNQAMPYPNTVFSQQYVDYPGPEKFGEQCNVTAELVFADQTKQIYDSAASVGEMTGWYEERDKLRTFLGIKNPYSANGTAANTYRTSGSIINQLTTFSYNDFRAINTLEQILATQVDPSTGLPLAGDIKDIFVMPTRMYDIKRIYNATEVRSAGSVTNDLLISGNPLSAQPNIWTSQYARTLLTSEGGLTSTQANTVLIAGDFKKAFIWRQVWPVTVTQLPPGNEREFDRDIVLSIKASGFGVAAVAEPRVLVYGYVA